MTAIQIPARSLIVQVRAADGSTYLPVKGITSWTVNPAEGEETTDTTTYDSNGNAESRKMQIGKSMAGEGKMIKDHATGVQDAGQARIEVLADSLAEDSVGRIRFRHPMESVWKIWDVIVSIGEQGGGNNDMTGWSCTFTRTGASTTASAP
ncbi:phage tail tube protein [Parafrankia sp. EUN1f]|uniref:phage tail tube protein n=1 Tax=Parafrankia sp. EUN1f TaxID=102897 RepID=UPI0001C46CE8|nr:hypothetical protein [Parafrankia sp. EUN1f]EFC80251.1 hypothetical protein FrEUN1fDRAFT_6645 [Parafrankia sp. EUN1f]